MTDLVRHGRVRNFLFHASRRPSFLWKFAMAMLLVGTAVGYAGHRLSPSGPWNLGERVLALSGEQKHEPDPKMRRRLAAVQEDRFSVSLAEVLRGQLADPTVKFAHVIRAIPDIAPLLKPAEHDQIKTLLHGRFSAAQADLAFAYLGAFDEKNRLAYENLKAIAANLPPLRYARYALGKIEMERENYHDAHELFRAEGELPDARESRYMAVDALVEAKDFASLAKLQSDPRYTPFFSPYVSLQVAIGSKDWRGIFKWAPVTQVDTFETRILVMTLIAAVAWAFFLAHLGEMPALFSTTSLLCLLGFGLGVLSTIPTVYLAIWQDDILHFSGGEDVVRTFAYNIGGVGAREELCKLLLFAVLLPVLIKRDDEFEALIVASFIGLGFAIEENGSYFMMSAGGSAPGRFLTANFSHVAMTGVNGLALFRACTRGGAGLNDFLFVFPLTVLAHGVYDALIDLPEWDNAGYLAPIVIVAFASYYFRRVAQLRQQVRTTISLTGAFVFGVSLLAAAMTAFQIMNLGPSAGSSLILTELVGSAALLFMFFREFNEPLAG
jgi:protease PrsW